MTSLGRYSITNARRRRTPSLNDFCREVQRADRLGEPLIILPLYSINEKRIKKRIHHIQYASDWKTQEPDSANDSCPDETSMTHAQTRTSHDDWTSPYHSY
jgi:hypothetical protein